MTVRYVGLVFISSIFLIITLLFAYSHAQQAQVSQKKSMPVAEVVWVKGQVQAVAVDKTMRILKRKDIIFAHETLRSGPASECQIVFSDGSLLAIRENTEFRIDEYQFNKKDAANNSFLGNLIKGGLRTVTGFISKMNPEKYKLNTPVATIGVRGTEFSIACGDSNGCEFLLSKGQILLKNAHGELMLDKKNPFAKGKASESPRSLKNAPAVFKSDPKLISVQPGDIFKTPTSPNSGINPAGGNKSVNSFCIS